MFWLLPFLKFLPFHWLQMLLSAAFFDFYQLSMLPKRQRVLLIYLRLVFSIFDLVFCVGSRQRHNWERTILILDSHRLFLRLTFVSKQWRLYVCFIIRFGRSLLIFEISHLLHRHLRELLALGELGVPIVVKVQRFFIWFVLLFGFDVENMLSFSEFTHLRIVCWIEMILMLIVLSWAVIVVTFPSLFGAARTS